MDGDREKKGEGSGSRPQAPRPPRDPRDAPRGRGLGAPTASNFRCARCGELSTVAAAAAMDARCGKCGADLHTCTHCNHFDPAASLQCRQTIPARIAKKDVANRCELFEPRLRQEFEVEKPSSGPSSAGPKDPRAAFDALFKF
jgi:hypothetical protein